MLVATWIFVLIIRANLVEGSFSVDYDSVLKSLKNTLENNTVSPACFLELEKLGQGVLQGETWALKMLDSTSKIPSGILTGNIIEMGNYDECLEINEIVDNTNIKGKFCKTTISSGSSSMDETVGKSIQVFERQLNKTELTGQTRSNGIPIQPTLYFCIPKSCRAKDLNQILELLNFDDEECFDADSGADLDGLAIGAIVIFTTIGLITVVSTVYDIYCKLTQRDVSKAAITFSLYTNSRKLFHTSTDSQHLMSIDGIKSMSMIWVVVGHLYMTYLFVPLDNYVDTAEYMKSLRSQFIGQGTLAVDTFLLIGGFLTVYSFQTAVDKGVKFRPFLSYFHRFWRLTPSLAAMLLAHVALFNYFGSGPVWKNTDTYLVQGCRKYWWSALLYVQNYVNPNGIAVRYLRSHILDQPVGLLLLRILMNNNIDSFTTGYYSTRNWPIIFLVATLFKHNINRTCIPQSWYLSMDMQLFLLSPIVLLSLKKWPLYTNLGLGFLSLAATVASFAIGWHFELGATLQSQVDGIGLENFMKYYYMPTHIRMIPYLFGIMLGYEVHRLKKSRQALKMDQVAVVIAWVISVALMFTCVMVPHSMTRSDEPDLLGHSIFLALSRPAWAAAICWVVFACAMGMGGPVDKFLSLPAFQILSRLSYSIYIVHYSFLFMTSFSTRYPMHFSDYNALHKFWGDFIFISVISIFWTLIFESPFIALEKLIFGGAKRSRVEINANVNNIRGATKIVSPA